MVDAWRQLRTQQSLDLRPAYRRLAPPATEGPRGVEVSTLPQRPFLSRVRHKQKLARMG
jgi:hypothetical protein